MAFRVVCFIDNLGSGGAQRQLARLGCLFQERGLEVEFLVYGAERFMASPLLAAKVPIYMAESGGAFARIRSCCKILKQRNPDVVISFLDTPNFISCCARLSGLKSRLLLNERSARGFYRLPLKLKLFRLMNVLFGDRIICNSRNAEMIWRERYPRVAGKLRTIYNPIPCFSAETSACLSAKASGVRTIVVAASYQYLKNPLGCVEALHLLSPEERRKLHVDWYGNQEVVRGDTRAYNEACRKIKEYGLETVITLHSATPQILEKMQAADAIGLFSFYEGLPNAICEALMLGKPVLMSRVSDYSVIVDEECAFLCDPNQPGTIAAGFRQLITCSDAELQRMGEHAAEKANALFSQEKIIQQWMDEMELG